MIPGLDIGSCLLPPDVITLWRKNARIRRRLDRAADRRYFATFSACGPEEIRRAEQWVNLWAIAGGGR